MAKWDVIEGDCLEELRRCGAEYDTCIMDPPYAMPILTSERALVGFM